MKKSIGENSELDPLYYKLLVYLSLHYLLHHFMFVHGMDIFHRVRLALKYIFQTGALCHTFILLEVETEKCLCLILENFIPI